jgi:hypothetical protein
MSANGAQGTDACGGSNATVEGQRCSGPSLEKGSVVAVEKHTMPLCASLPAQKILATDAAVNAVDVEDSANYWHNDVPMMGSVLAGCGGSSVHNNDVRPGMFFKDQISNCTFDNFGHCMPSIGSNAISHESNFNDTGPCLSNTMVGSLEFFWILLTVLICLIRKGRWLQWISRV